MLRNRWTVLVIGLAFSVSLAVVVGQRLSGEAMAVVIGVMAGVVASVPTSLIVVWFANRPRVTRTNMDIPARPAPEPRILLMPARPAAHPAQAATRLAEYGAQSYAGYAQGAVQPSPYPPAEPALAPRHFTVIGGSEMPGEIELADPDYGEEVVTWQR